MTQHWRRQRAGCQSVESGTSGVVVKMSNDPHSLACSAKRSRELPLDQLQPLEYYESIRDIGFRSQDRRTCRRPAPIGRKDCENIPSENLSHKARSMSNLLASYVSRAHIAQRWTCA
jgi:hypothetical protein